MLASCLNIRNQRKNTSKHGSKYPEYSNIKIFENSLASDLVFVLGETGEKVSFPGDRVRVWNRVWVMV